MKILFTSPLPTVVYGLAPALTALGTDVIVTDARSGHDQDPLHLFSLLSAYNPDFVFSPGGWDIDDRYLMALSQKRTPMIFWAFDDPALFRSVSLRYAKFSQHIFTTASECIPRYSREGFKAHLLMFGCLPSFHHRVAPNDHLSHDCIFVGNNYDFFHSRRVGIDIILKPLLDKDYDIKIYGNSWWLDNQRPFHINDRFYGGYLNYETMRTAYSSAKIVLGIHSVNTSPTMMSMRTFEALACGAFFLTQWTPAIENTFINHKHLVWSKSPDETVELVDYYLSHPEEREKIAKCGQAEVYAKHTYQIRAQDLLKILTSSQEEDYRKSWIFTWSEDGGRGLRSISVKRKS